MYEISQGERVSAPHLVDFNNEIDGPWLVILLPLFMRKIPKNCEKPKLASDSFMIFDLDQMKEYRTKIEELLTSDREKKVSYASLLLKRRELRDMQQQQLISLDYTDTVLSSDTRKIHQSTLGLAQFVDQYPLKDIDIDLAPEHTLVKPSPFKYQSVGTPKPFSFKKI